MGFFCMICTFSEETPQFVSTSCTVAELLDDYIVREFHPLSGVGEARPTTKRAIASMKKAILAGEFLPTPILASTSATEYAEGERRIPIVRGATRFAALKELLDEGKIERSARVPVVIYLDGDPKDDAIKAHYRNGTYSESDQKMLEGMVGIGVSGAASELREIARSIAETLNDDETSLLYMQFRASKSSGMMKVESLLKDYAGDLATSLIGTAKILKKFGVTGTQKAVTAISRVLQIAAENCTACHEGILTPPPNHNKTSIRFLLGVANLALWRELEGGILDDEAVAKEFRTINSLGLCTTGLNRQVLRDEIWAVADSVFPSNYDFSEIFAVLDKASFGQTSNKPKRSAEEIYADAYEGIQVDDEEILSKEAVPAIVESVKGKVSQESGPGQLHGREALSFLKHAIFGEEDEHRETMIAEGELGSAKFLYGEDYEDVTWQEPPPADESVAKLIEVLPLSGEDVFGPVPNNAAVLKGEPVRLDSDGSAVVRAMVTKPADEDAPSPAKPKRKARKTKEKEVTPQWSFETMTIPFFTENPDPEKPAENMVAPIEVAAVSGITKLEESQPAKPFSLDVNQHPAVLAHKRSWRRPTEKRQLIEDGFAPPGVQPDGERYFEHGGFIWDLKLFEEQCEWLGYHLLRQGKPPYRPPTIDATWEDEEDAAELARLRLIAGHELSWLNDFPQDMDYKLGGVVTWVMTKKKIEEVLNGKGGDWWC